MNTTFIQTKNLKISILWNISIIGIIYFIPILSHLINLPIYVIEPLRILVLLSMIYSSRQNTILIALSLPLISHIFSGHPYYVKSILISTELLVNIILFDFIIKRNIKPFKVPIFLFISIVLSKILYYILKFIFINYGLLNGNLISTPLTIQLIICVFISFIFFMLKNNSKIYPTEKG